MSRTFTNVDLVQLPRVDSHGAIALASAVESAASSMTGLPPSILDAITQIVDDRQRLLTAIAKTPAGTLTVKEADRRIDRVAVALHNIAQAWADLAEFIPAGNDAKLVMERVFQDGRRFVNLNVKEEWAEIETKLATIERENLLPKLTAIGAGPVLDLLKETHVTYGRVLGTTQAIEEAPEIRECRDALLDSLRSYTIQVAATVKRNDAASATRADVLLKPLREWESSKPAAPSAPAVPGDNQP